MAALPSTDPSTPLLERANSQPASQQWAYSLIG